MEVLQLISLDHVHPHDLIFCENEVIHLNGNEEKFCCACSKSLAGVSFYHCSKCDFFLHKICAELPHTIKHPSHRKHPLIFHPNSPYASNQDNCDMCGLYIPTFSYHCSDCKFDLDIDCALLAQCFTQPESHKHHFTKWFKSDPFTCDFCGTCSEKYRSKSSRNHKLKPWICSVCHVVVHNKCMSLSFSVQLPQHDHPLIHTYFIPQSHQSIALICRICGQEVNREFGCYSCENCSWVVHVDCALDNVQEVGQKFWADEIEAAEDQLVEQEIEHFSHPHHKLFLVQNHDDEIETKCDGCMRIISYPFYKCLECDFSLHIACSKLPKKINHPLHKKHHLILVESDNLGFYCWSCHTWSQGFSYRCLTCRSFIIDIRCALVNPFEFFHDSHKHPLSLFTQSNKYPQCTSCGKGKVASLGFMLRCKQQCPFALHYRCATLPSTIKYEYDEHSLILSYPGDGNSNLHHDSNEYPYCDICQEYRDPNLWFYACPNYSECPNYLHPKCAQVDYPYVKLGTRIKVSFFHQHELVFTLRNEDFIPCYLCGKKDQKTSLECYKEDCNFSVHLFCFLHARAP